MNIRKNLPALTAHTTSAQSAVHYPIHYGGLDVAKPYSGKPDSAVQETAKPYSAKPYSAKPISGIC